MFGARRVGSVVFLAGPVVPLSVTRAEDGFRVEQMTGAARVCFHASGRVLFCSDVILDQDIFIFTHTRSSRSSDSR